jgi:integrase
MLTLVFGLRRGEVLGLSWSDVDFSRHRLTVRQQVRRLRISTAEDGRGRWELRLQPLKTRRSRRVLHLTDLLEAQLRAHHARQAVERHQVGAPDDASTDLVFTSTVGTAIDPDNFGHAFQRTCRRAGLGRWHLHELRHSAASIMLAQGIPLWVVSEVLGHASIAVTKDVYGHLIAGEVAAATEAISGALFSGSTEADSPCGT